MSLRTSPLPFYTSQQSHSTSNLLGSQRGSSPFSGVTRLIRFLSCRRTLGFRIREKYVVLFGIVVLLCICYSGYVFLPEGPSKPGSDINIKNVIKNVWELPQQVDANQLVIPLPNYVGINNTYIRREHVDMNRDDDPHKLDDRKRFLDKVEADDAGQIPKPKPDDEIARLEQNKNDFRRNTRETIVGNILTSNNADENEKRREKIKEVRQF